MPIALPLTLNDDPAGVRTWSLGEISASLLASPGGWRFQGAGPGLLLPFEASLAIEAAVGDAAAVARLDAPMLLLPNTAAAFWLAWPLVLRVTLGEGGPTLERRRPSARKTVLGPIDRGAVLPAFVTAVLSGPDDPTLPAWTHAALRVVVDNATPDVVQLRRALVNEPVLALFQKGDRLAAGDLRIRVHDSATAEALAGSGDPPPGYTCVDPGRAPAAMPALSWLMDATHRSVEFAL